MPIAREFRVFVRDAEVECIHPYWPPASIERPDNKDYLAILQEFSQLSVTEKCVLTELAECIGEKVGGYWSIDFCELEEGGWVMTDMALGDDSYHWPTCKYAPETMMRIYGDPMKVDPEKTLVDYIEGLNLKNKEAQE